MASGDTFTDGSVKYTMTSMNVPEPVMSLAVQPVSKDAGGQVSGSVCFNYFCIKIRLINYYKPYCINQS